MLQSTVDPLIATSWSTFGGRETLESYGTSLSDDWEACVPAAHWEFLMQLPAVFETNTHIFVHGAVDGEIPVDQQDENHLIWGRKFGMTNHVSGKKVICGHTPEADGKIGVYPWGACIDTGCFYGEWLSCLNVDSGEFWQTNEKGDTRSGSLD